MSDEKLFPGEAASSYKKVLDIISNNRLHELEDCLKQIKPDSLLCDILIRCLDEVATQNSIPSEPKIKVNMDEVLDMLLKFAAGNMSVEAICHVMGFGFFSKEASVLADSQDKLKKLADNPTREEIVNQAIQRFGESPQNNVQIEEMESEVEEHKSTKFIPEQKEIKQKIKPFFYPSASIDQLSPESKAKLTIEKIKQNLLALDKFEITGIDQKLSLFISTLRKVVMSEGPSTDPQYYQARLQRITALAAKAFELGKNFKLPAEVVFFHWQNASIDRANFHHFPKPSSKAYRLLHLSQIANSIVNKIISKTSTRLDDNNKSREEIREIDNQITYDRYFVNDQYKKIKSNFHMNHEQEIALWRILTASLAEDSHSGNCQVMSFVLLNFLRKLCPPVSDKKQDSFNKITAEVFSIEGGDHAFIVMGRDPLSNPEDYTTWGPDAIVCDPWAGKQYFPWEIADELRNFRLDPNNLPNQSEPLHLHHHHLESVGNLETYCRVHASMKSNLNDFDKEKESSIARRVLSKAAESKKKSVQLNTPYNFRYSQEKSARTQLNLPLPELSRTSLTTSR